MLDAVLAQGPSLTLGNAVVQIMILVALFGLMTLMLPHSNKKNYTPQHCANVLITGGVQGIGKLLVQQFARSHQLNSVNLIVIDIREDLAKELVKDVRAATGDPNFKNIHFFKANLADTKSAKATWERIRAQFGPVHVLVNNHARCMGKRVDEMSIEQFKLTMDINFHSYVQLSMLFLAQPEIKRAPEEVPQGFHLVNVNSIAGHATCQRNSDYSASKYALNGFTDSLRQELEFTGSPVKMTNFYPYYIDTGLFEGFKPVLGWVIPTLKADRVATRMHKAIVCEEQEVYIEAIIWYLKIVLQILPLCLRNKLSHLLVGQGMEYFVGRVQTHFESTATKAD